MQAIKLHQKHTPYLGAESYLVPVFEWTTAKTIVRRWIGYLERDGGKENKHAQYMTLVKIPDGHPVSLSLSPILKGLFFQAHTLTYAPWASIDSKDKRHACQWMEHLVHDGADLERYNLPELVLGSTLVPKHIKWTKKTRLLYASRSKSNIVNISSDYDSF